MSARPTTPEAQLVHVLGHRGIDLVIDVGANAGQYARRLFDHGYDGEVVSVEPLAACHAALAAAARDNRRWRVAPRMALGDRDGEIAINVSAESDMSSARDFDEAFLASSPSSAFVAVERAPLRRLDAVYAELAGAARRVLLKIDTQGYEREVLAGATGVLDRLHGVQVEMSLVPLYAGEADFDELHALLARRGFRPHLFLPGYYSRHMGRMVQVDGVYLREPG